VADPHLLQARAGQLGLPLRIETHIPDSAVQPHLPGRLCVLPVELAQRVEPGRLDPRNAAYVLAALRTAATLCLTGSHDALVTGPVQKSVINDAGIAFTGHTEF